jgi:hypothetical protein
VPIYPNPFVPPLFSRSNMTSPDDDFGQASNNTNTNAISIVSGPHQHSSSNYNRRIHSNSNNSYTSTNGMELRLLMTSRDAGAVIGTCETR